MVKLEENVHLLHVVSWGWRYIWCLFKNIQETNTRDQKAENRGRTRACDWVEMEKTESDPFPPSQRIPVCPVSQ